MIYESYYWKKELLKLSDKLTKRIPAKKFWTESQHGTFEKEIMIGFYMVRKLIESKKLTNKLVSTKIKGNKLPNIGKEIHLLNNHRFYKYFDFDKRKKESFELIFLCNQIVHSYIFSPFFHEPDINKYSRLAGIHFCSDTNKNNWLYEIDIETIIKLFESVGNNYPSAGHYKYNPKKKDYDFVNTDEIKPIPKEIEEIISKNEAKNRQTPTEKLCGAYSL